MQTAICSANVSSCHSPAQDTFLLPILFREMYQYIQTIGLARIDIDCLAMAAILKKSLMISSE